MLHTHTSLAGLGPMQSCSHGILHKLQFGSACGWSGIPCPFVLSSTIVCLIAATSCFKIGFELFSICVRQSLWAVQKSTSVHTCSANGIRSCWHGSLGLCCRCNMDM
jgi:hypothetical protein